MSWRRRRDLLQELLIAAAAEPHVARGSWERWSAARALDDVSWEELRLLGAVAARADALGVAPAVRPRLDGIRRFVWTQTQSRLAGALPALRRLREQGIPVCLLKGAALIAGGHRSAGERFLRDVDVLVPRERLADAVRGLLDAGWRHAHYASLDEVFSLGFPRCHALAFRRQERPESEIDLHLSANELGRFPRSDAGLWARSVPARLFGLPLSVPAPEDLLCATLVHSFVSDGSEGLDWAPDALALARRPGFDWPLLAADAYRRGVDALVDARLRALRHLGLFALPAAFAWVLDARETAPELRRELELLERRRPWRGPSAPAVRSAARALRARRLLEADGAAASEQGAPLPAACAWLRLDAPLPAGFTASGGPREIEVAGRILHAGAPSPIPYRLYCGSVRLADGRTLPRRTAQDGSVHEIRVKARLDPAVATAEGRPPLSLYFGRRSRAASPLGPAAVLGIDRVG